MDQRERAALDRHITGNYGEDQFKQQKKYRFPGHAKEMTREEWLSEKTGDEQNENKS